MTEYVIKEVGRHQWLVFANRQSIAVCADENEALKLIVEHSVASRRSPAQQCNGKYPTCSSPGLHLGATGTSLETRRQSAADQTGLPLGRLSQSVKKSAKRSLP